MTLFFSYNTTVGCVQYKLKSGYQCFPLPLLPRSSQLLWFLLSEDSPNKVSLSLSLSPHLLRFRSDPVSHIMVFSEFGMANITCFLGQICSNVSSTWLCCPFYFRKFIFFILGGNWKSVFSKPPFWGSASVCVCFLWDGDFGFFFVWVDLKLNQRLYFAVCQQGFSWPRMKSLRISLGLSSDLLLICEKLLYPFV